MKNYKDSDYAVNKFSEGIVYRFADGATVTYTLTDYLAENPGKTEDDFLVLKELSDNIYLIQVNAENAQTKKNVSLDDLSGAIRYAPSPEDLLVSEIDAREINERREQQIEISRCALDRLTDVQCRRYLMYHIDGLTLRQIANMEGVTFQVIDKSISAAEKKIKKFLADGRKTG